MSMIEGVNEDDSIRTTESDLTVLKTKINTDGCSSYITIGDAISKVMTNPTPEITGIEAIRETLQEIASEPYYKIVMNEFTQHKLIENFNIHINVIFNTWYEIPIEIDNNTPDDYINLYKSVPVSEVWDDVMYLDKVMKL